jgi:hypothetical protein
MIVRFYMGIWQMVFLDLPLIIASFWSISAFYVIAQRELHPRSWKRSILLLPMLMAVGVALTVINTRAVLEALFGIQTAFARTPKYAIGDRPVNLEVKKYRRRSGLLPFIEIAVGTYFVAMIVFAIETFNFFSIPFLLLFVFGPGVSGAVAIPPAAPARSRAGRRAVREVRHHRLPHGRGSETGSLHDHRII